MTVIASLITTLGLESSAFKTGLAEANKAWRGTQRKFAAIGADLQSAGTAMSVGITAPFAALSVSSFNAASDAAELQSAFDQTFAGMTTAMNSWAEATGDAMGRSTQEMQKAANTFGIFFNTAVPKQRAAEMSQTFAKLAQDLGSFYNVDTETAIEKLRSGLSGESEPLRDFGVFLTEAAVKAKAMELGLSGVGNELTEQEKIVARYALILEATKNAQGDVERTSAGTANQVRAAKAAFEELQVTVGTKLLPVVTPLITALAQVLEAFNTLPPPVQTVILGAAALSAALGPVLIGVGSLVTTIGQLLPVLAALRVAIMTQAIPAAVAFLATLGPILVPLAAVAAGVGAVVLAVRNWDKIKPYVDKVLGWVAGLYQGVKTWLVDKMKPVLEGVMAPIRTAERGFAWLYDRVVGNSWIPDMVDEIGDHMRRLDDVLVAPAEIATLKTNEALKDLYQGVTMQTPGEDAEETATRILHANDDIQFSFADTARSVGSSLESLVGATRDGDWLGALGSVADVVAQVASAIGGPQSRVAGIAGAIAGSLPGGFGGFRANGGPVLPGRSYVVGERGPELFTPRGAGSIAAAGSFGGPSRLEIVPSALFDVVVDGRVQRTAGPMVAAGSAQARYSAQSDIAYRQSRNVG